MTRLDQSRKLLADAFSIAFGSYIKQEVKKGDTFRDHIHIHIPRKR